MSGASQSSAALKTPSDVLWVMKSNYWSSEIAFCGRASKTQISGAIIRIYSILISSARAGASTTKAGPRQCAFENDGLNVVAFRDLLPDSRTQYLLTTDTRRR